MTNSIEVLKQCTVEGMIVKLPPVQLDRKVYNDVAKALQGIGGKWKGGKVAGFVFPHDPTELLEQVQGGEKKNLKKEFQFFATPDELADMLVEMADIQEGHLVLEPSAGQGAIIEAIYRAFPRTMKGPNDDPCVTVDYYELMPQNREILDKKFGGLIGEPDTTKNNAQGRTSAMGNDFLLAHEHIKYDRIVANPPFSKNQDIDHVRKMYSVLKEGGRMVSVMSPHWRFASDKKESEFRSWLDQLDANTYQLDKGTFKTSGTMVRSVVVMIDK